MFCFKCGFEIKDGYKFCPKCGAPAYVEKEESQSELEAPVEDVKVDAEKKDNDGTEISSEPKTTFSSNETKASSSTNNVFVPNPLIEKELDIEGIKKRAEGGDKNAMHRQAFRYEMGIGCEIDIDKAEELYKKAGGKNVLLALEHTHINSIMPDPIYDVAIRPTYDENNDFGVTLKVIPFVKDLLLDYAYKIDKDRKIGQYSREKSLSYKNIFMEGINKVKALHPEFFFSYDNELNDLDSSNLYETIKNNAKKRYSFKWLPSLFNLVDYIDEERIEVPGIYHIHSEGFFVIYYSTPQLKKSLLHQFVNSVMMQIPIKKVNLNFVDIAQKFEARELINELDSKVYNNLPITSFDQLKELINKVENRRVEIIKKYGNYPDFCESNRTIPLPYEFIFLFDDSYTNQYEELDSKIDSIKEYGHSIGVYIVEFRENIFPSLQNNVRYNKKRNFAITKEDINENTLYINGVSYECINKKSKNNYQSTIKNIEFLNIPMFNGYGDYEVVLKPRTFIADMSFWNKAFPSLLDNTNLSVMTSFPTESEAFLFVNTYCQNNRLPDATKREVIPSYIYLIPGIKAGFVTANIVITLCIPYNYVEYILKHTDDLYFYLSLLNSSTSIYNEVLDVLNKNERNEKGIDTSEWGGKKLAWFTRSSGYSYFMGGYIFSFWEDLKFKNYNDCVNAIKKIEAEIQDKAFSKWGNEWDKHVGFGENFFYNATGAFLRVEYWKHKKISILDCSQELDSNNAEYRMSKFSLSYINKEINLSETKVVLRFDFNYSKQFEIINDYIHFTVGKGESKDVDFRMDLVSHVHSFIIGQSGSGKSVFLHNIIGGAMLKYAPEDLQLYLLDFKLGGVEFNRYLGAKHVKALLVDNSDPQVTLEILRELRGSMTERGKLLRSAGVNNIGEYNKLHQEDRMPHVLVVADECHEMFKADDSIPRQVRNEISDIVIKIAKEGRSQGVHLVFATQTLSGTEISSEIINNVSDFYLLKCAQTDSERLVPNSSAITSELSTGQIYYHHVDEQVKFQAYYTDKEAAEKLMAAIVEKAKDHRSNGEFYFNGAQMFYLDESVKEQMLTVKGKSPVAFMGKAIDISQKDLYIKLNEDFSENVLLLGLNDQEQVTRTTMNLFVSLMMSAKLKHKDIAFKVIDCLNNEEGEVHELIFDLENEGYCEIIERRQRSKFFKELAQSVLDGTAEETILLILGQDRFRELKMDMELEESNNSKSSDDDDMMSISDDFFGDSSSSSTSVRTYRDAMNVILEKGPDYGVHTLLQIEKASNLLFEDYITPKVVFQKFKHLVMLKSDETAGVTLHLNDDIRLEKLSSDWERLRAYYYAEESDSYTLFTPYMPSKSKDIINLLKMI